MFFIACFGGFCRLRAQLNRGSSPLMSEATLGYVTCLFLFATLNIVSLVFTVKMLLCFVLGCKEKRGHKNRHLFILKTLRLWKHVT